MKLNWMNEDQHTRLGNHIKYTVVEGEVTIRSKEIRKNVLPRTQLLSFFLVLVIWKVFTLSITLIKWSIMAILSWLVFDASSSNSHPLRSNNGLDNFSGCKVATNAFVLMLQSWWSNKGKKWPQQYEHQYLNQKCFISFLSPNNVLQKVNVFWTLNCKKLTLPCRVMSTSVTTRPRWKKTWFFLQTIFMQKSTWWVPGTADTLQMLFSAPKANFKAKSLGLWPLYYVLRG